MGRRSAGETISAIYMAFVRQHSWSQVDLASLDPAWVHTLEVEDRG